MRYTPSGMAAVLHRLGCSIASNTGRQRLDINGAINVETLPAEVRFDASPRIA